ncbi:MAG: glycosyltransferase family 4 protein [Prevotella sp.]|nr:glycosyltransferase family 4 protein [Prevotella sp.]
MRILYDAQTFTSSRVSGISRSFCELITHMPEDVQAEISVVRSRNIHLQNSLLCPNLITDGWNKREWKSKFNIKGAGKIYDLISFINPYFPSAERDNMRCSIRMLKEGNFDVFHPTKDNPYFLKYIGNKPFVLTVHDMMPEILTQFFKKNNKPSVWKRQLVDKAAAIVAVSECTKRDLIRVLNVPEEKITVIHHGGPDPDTSPEQPIVNRPYFLYVGMRGAYKNFSVLVKDFAKCLRRIPDLFLVCTYTDFTKEEKKLIDACGMRNNIMHISATDAELRNLYKNAVAYVFPSIYEGFGMPILEAFSYGCPVLLNNKSCFPEVAGNAALYFDSDEKHSDIDVAIETAWNWSDEERMRMKALGLERLKMFSWKESAKKLSVVYAKVIS